VSEDATGREEHLYTEPALPPDLVQVLEKRFFDYLDRRAAEALSLLSTKPHGPLNADQRRAWSQFVMAYHLRHPDAFSEIKAAATKAWDSGDGKAQEKYAKIRKPDDPELFTDYATARDPYVKAKAITRLLMSTSDNQRLGATLDVMEWNVLDLSNAGRLFERPYFGVGKRRIPAV
jgi:hypothetical protein